MELMKLDNLMQVLEDLSKDLKEGYIDQMIRDDHRASGELIDSITSRIDVEGRSYQVIFSMESYWKYLEHGTKPHFPPVSAILRWIQIKPVIPRPLGNGKIPTEQQLAYMIAKSIGEKGTKATNSLQIAKDHIIPHYRERLSEALRRDAWEYMSKFMTFN